MLLVAACGSATPQPVLPGVPSASPSPSRPAPALTPTRVADRLPGMPADVRPGDIYAADRQGVLPRLRGVRPLVYVPNGRDGTVSVIDPRTYQVLRTVPAGRIPQHVVPSYDLRTLWVNSSGSNSLTRIDPVTGTVVGTVSVDDPYNLYFTPDGRFAVVMAERQRRIDFRDPQTMALRDRLRVPCLGLNHADFSADGRFFVVSCEFSGQLVKVDTARRRIVGTLRLPQGSKPQDVKLSADGRTFYVADLNRGGVYTVDGGRLRVTGFLRTGAGTHGLYISRDSRDLYITNRGSGTISVLSLATGRIRTTWTLPAGSSPDMGNLTPDGRTLWISSRYGDWVNAVDVSSGRQRARVRVGRGPHGLTVFPQPGRYSLGHTGVLR